MGCSQIRSAPSTSLATASRRNDTRSRSVPGNRRVRGLPELAAELRWRTAMRTRGPGQPSLSIRPSTGRRRPPPSAVPGLTERSRRPVPSSAAPRSASAPHGRGCSAIPRVDRFDVRCGNSLLAGDERTSRGRGGRTSEHGEEYSSRASRPSWPARQSRIASCIHGERFKAPTGRVFVPRLQFEGLEVVQCRTQVSLPKHWFQPNAAG